MASQIPAQNMLLHKPEVAWKTIVKDIVMLEAYRYRLTVVPVDVNEPGAMLAVKEVGFFLIDFVGSVYIIAAINVGSDPTKIEVTDDFHTGYSPQSGQPAIVFKSAWDGTAPFLAPVKLDQLDKSAKDNYQAIEKSILWLSQKPLEIIFQGTNKPAVSYSDLYRKIFSNNPKITLITPEYDINTGLATGNELEDIAKPRRVMSNGLLVGIDYDLAPMAELQNGKIIISR